tara:strand:- start:14 stop:469 length:456 start_codon:yes stop_codon:yes gene_type:complete
MLNRIFKTTLLGALALVIATTFTSCKKEKDTVAVIIVQDGSGNTVSNARVILHANQLKQSLYTYDPDNYSSLDNLVKSNLDTVYSPRGQNSDLFRAESTDENGRAEFILPLEMVLNISVLKLDGNDEYLGVNVINIQKEKTTTQFVKLLNY